MIIKQGYIENSKQKQDLLIKDGKIKRIANHIDAPEEKVIDANGKLIIPPFVDSHVHLDSTLTAGEPRFNESGTLFEGISIWADRKKSLSAQDVKGRAIQTLKNQAKHGIQFVRSHVDTTDPDFTALKALLEVREEVSDFIDLQLVAFPQEGILSFPNGRELLEEAVKMGVDAVGGIPHYEFNQYYGRDSLEFLMNLAEKYDRLVDVHCDEIDDPNSRNLEVLATLAYESGMKDRVTASHTTALGSYNDAYADKLMRLLRMSQINMVANPLVNMHLGGRFDTYPKRRGLTRVKELLEHGINVSFGEDDIKDPWYPMGNGNMLDALYVGILASQLMGYHQIMDSYKLVTTNASKTLHVSDHYGIDEGKPASFLIFDTDNFYNEINERKTLLYSIRNGKILVQKQPEKIQTYFD
ncbi:cytosine deaminase [Fructilactobacillus fructivorans]|uniref:Cytosine deaminase n=1 Tax=Fructilactobacillus fructivorans TaxID=1614 RepID=A0A0C1LYT2_9LACO|nr:cytosine deaminase [Fructilactobacillus fructivorans]KID42055.1 Cytosine deaminase [Fructilactobacillus fructivorans]MCT0151947.1 cytosine deaminase [Fructilactobacillus fructivorans]MCT2867839.1 cytosine deaminase [Fructilactobacillus fructivorans]MCT2868579.1 cytosine deaminase [Fructilactobacillus fructivorans]MCT2873579.1 cytosine deaminase [Fructilactobacillus fructivorans]